MSNNPYSPSETSTAEYLAVSKSPPWHLRLVIRVLIAHAVLSLISFIFSRVTLWHMHRTSIATDFFGFVAVAMLFVTAYLLHRRNKWAFIPPLLYLLQKCMSMVGMIMLFQSYISSHQDKEAFNGITSDSFFLSTLLTSFALPMLMGISYTGYCLYQRKRLLQ